MRRKRETLFMLQLLDFETELETLEAGIADLRRSEGGDDLLQQIAAMEKKRDKELKRMYGKLNDWQICQVARHPARPHAEDYIAALTEDFMELSGDRLYADDNAVVAGLARFDEKPIAVIGHRKGRGTQGRLDANFGMPGPEGYRKVLRIMELAEKFHLPLLSFVDTPGAYPGIGAEERGQAGAIGACLRRAAGLRTPLLALVIGEGGSGGALAMAVGDYVGMMEYAIYSVISPEGCASILWKDSSRMADAAGLLGLTAAKLKKLNLIDEIVAEPSGGAHRLPPDAFAAARTALSAALSRLSRLSEDKLTETRAARLRNYGAYKEV